MVNCHIKKEKKFEVHQVEVQLCLGFQLDTKRFWIGIKGPRTVRRTNSDVKYCFLFSFFLTFSQSLNCSQKTIKVHQ